jgi:hypothetical protein
MSGHTPGPWRVLQPSVGVDANWHVTDELDTFVAHVYGFGHSVDDQSRINAHLIAAAPDLLAALKELAAWFDRSDTKSADSALRKAARAIAKAKGKP